MQCWGYVTWMALPIGAPGAPSMLGLEMVGGMVDGPRGWAAGWKPPWSTICPAGRCGGWKLGALLGGAGAWGCCIWDCGSTSGFMMGEVMGTGGRKLSGTWGKKKGIYVGVAAAGIAQHPAATDFPTELHSGWPNPSLWLHTKWLGAAQPVPGHKSWVQPPQITATLPPNHRFGRPALLAEKTNPHLHLFLLLGHYI